MVNHEAPERLRRAASLTDEVASEHLPRRVAVVPGMLVPRVVPDACRAAIGPERARGKTIELPLPQDVTQVPVTGGLPRRVRQADSGFQSSAWSAAKGGWFHVSF